MLVRIPSIGPSLGPLMSDREVSEDALLGLGDSLGPAMSDREVAQDALLGLGQASPDAIAAMRQAFKDYLIAQTISIAYTIGAEVITKKSKNETIWRVLFLGMAGAYGYTTYRAFDLSYKSGPAANMASNVAGGVIGTVHGFLGLGAVIAAFSKIDTSEIGKKYTLKTVTQSVKSASKVVPVPV